MKFKKALSLFVIVLLSLTLVQAQSKKIKKYESIEGKFKIQFSQTPSTSTQEIDLKEGEKSTIHVFSEETATKAFMISYNTYPESIAKNLVIDEALEGAMKGFNDNLSLTIGTKKFVWIKRGSKSYKGILYKSSGKEMYVAAKVILVDSRLYQIVIMNTEENVSESDINQFIESFELL